MSYFLMSETTDSCLDFKKIESILNKGVHVANNTRKDIETRLDENVVTKDNKLNYQYIGETNQIETIIYNNNLKNEIQKN